MQCPVCFEPYDICERRPKIVTCGHTFCLHCLLRYKIYECPTCRMRYTCPPEELTDNFLALEETADMKFVQRSLWCETCSDLPRPECVEHHEVCSSRTAVAHLNTLRASALGEEVRLLGCEWTALQSMAHKFSTTMELLKERVQALKLTVQEAHQPAGPGTSGVKAMHAAIRASQSRTANAREALDLLDATEAELKVKCGGEWRTFSLDLGGAGAGAAARSESSLLLFTAYALARQNPPSVSQSTTFVMTATVFSSRVGPLPDITIEFDEMPSKATLQEHWSKGWKRYSICRSCLESRHAEAFTPQPPGTEDAAIEKGTVCVGRSSGKYYFTLCEDMRDKFILPLNANFKVVGRVVRNLSSLEAAVRGTIAPEDKVLIMPKARV